MDKEIKKQQCDYCENEAKYEQTLEWVDMETREKESIYRYACEDHKDHYED